MSETVDNFAAMMAPRCADCPVFNSQAELACFSEQGARRTADAMLDDVDGKEQLPSGLAKAVREIRSSFLEHNTETELRALRALGSLAADAPSCPGTKRGAPAYMPLSWRIQRYLSGQRICRSPAIGRLFPDGRF